MKEIEVKILDVNKEDIIAKLESLGAKKIFNDEIYAEYFKFENCTNTEKKIIRLRKMGKKVFFTVKKKISKDQFKIFEENEVEVSNFDEMKKALETIDLQSKLTYKKNRISYLLNNTRIEIDTYKEDYSFIPTFIEIEGSEEDIFKVVEKLGFEKKDALPWGWSELDKHYSN